MTVIPFPPESAGLTADDIPYGYSLYRDVLDDKRGYEPMVVGASYDEQWRPVIMVALSPGVYVEVTMVLAGQPLEDAGDALIKVLRTFLAGPSRTGLPPRSESARTPDQGSVTEGTGE